MEVFAVVAVKCVPLINSVQLPVALVLRLPEYVGIPFMIFFLFLVWVVGVIIQIGVQVVVVFPPDRIGWVAVVVLVSLSVVAPSVPITPPAPAGSGALCCRPSGVRENFHPPLRWRRQLPQHSPPSLASSASIPSPITYTTVGDSSPPQPLHCRWGGCHPPPAPCGDC